MCHDYVSGKAVSMSKPVMESIVRSPHETIGDGDVNNADSVRVTKWNQE